MRRSLVIGGAAAAGAIEIDVAEHSPAGLHDSVDDLVRAHGGHGVLHYWHLAA